MAVVIAWMFASGMNEVNGYEIQDVVTLPQRPYSVQPRLNARVARGTWDVYVTLRTALNDVDAIQEDLIAQVGKLLDYIARMDCVAVPPSCHQEWKKSVAQRLRVIQQKTFVHHHVNQPHSRKKRGLVDAVGKGLKWLVGTATTEDVDRALELINQARTANNKIVTSVDRLASVVDHALEDIHSNANNLHSALTIMNKMRDDIYWHARLIFDYKKILTVNYYTSALVDLQNKLDLLRAVHENNLQDIKMGRVTNQLVPDVLLNRIRRAVDPLHYWIPATLWLQWYGELSFVHEYEAEIVYKLSVPLLEQTEYILYNFETFPIWKNQSIFELDVVPRLLYDTVSSTVHVARPQDCVGDAPTVCRPVPLWDSAAFTCEVGLIVEHQESVFETCRFNVVPAPAETRINQPDNQRATLILPEQQISLACAGDPQKKVTLPNGVYSAVVPAACTLAGDNWKLKGTTLRVMSNSTQETDSVPIALPEYWVKDIEDIATQPRVNQSDIDELIAKVNFHRERQMEDREEVGNIMNDINEIQKMNTKNNMYPFADIGHHVGWANTLLIIVIIILSICACVWIYNRRDRLRFFLTRKRHRIELVSVGERESKAACDPDVRGEREDTPQGEEEEEV